ncbi:MAG: voltage-gated chloride channel family protein [Bdellovibrionales bacterium RIFCSPHIGHO2_01_FULL_40_29]|nr:MAG: voltage-gated chloride channel family protein [Bdellovibrionales bacterium RIFCSPHIGHO2_01_FULL_40_29]OFZ33603.1 MAG: voltage-gated chloride channel family protein [Bdellovibrionales bacterium RIFCSPHIGHO2_02_FULL_40_15]
MIKRYLKWTGLSSLSGLFAGVAAAVFLISLQWVTQLRDENQIIIWALPLAGLLIGWIYHRWGGAAVHGHNLILDELHNPQNVIPLRMSPFILVGTLITHLFGGSAGREGTAVQMGASLSDQISRLFHITSDERKILLAAGAGAGFGAAIGTPWAGAIFGMEVISIGRIRLFAWFECLVASFVGYYTTVFLSAPHSQFPKIEFEGFSIKILFWMALAGVAFGLVAKLFTMLTHGVEQLHARFVSYPPLRPFIGGVILVILFYIEGTYRYAGLGIPFIGEALRAPDSFRDPILKMFFTSLTVGSGFKGGEFIPLVFIGTTLGSALSIIIPISFQLLAAVGFAAVFAGAANTPIACTLMAMEIFGPQIGPYALVACFMSYYFSGHQGIYKAQKVHAKKHQRLISLFKR